MRQVGVNINDKICGSLMAGAAGDALGYAVEFKKFKDIISRYGGSGITRFELNDRGKAEISDDTQMTLFTANGVLMGLTRGAMTGIGGVPENYVSGAYQQAQHLLSAWSSLGADARTFGDNPRVGR